MKKIYTILVASLLLLTGCGSTLNTPTGAVEEFLSKYQNMDSTVLTQLDSVVANDDTMSDEQKKDYKDLMINQYKNLSYKVVDENIIDDEAEVDVEIEVLDYASNINESKNYYSKHKNEFSDNKKNNNSNDNNNNDDDNNNEIVGGTIGDAVDNISSFIDYKIKNLKGVTNTTTYTITFYLTKIDNEWTVEDMSDVDIQKLHGLYEG